MVIRSPKGERVVMAEDFFMKPSIDITRMTVLAPKDILTAIRIPNTWAGAKFYFEKVADRQYVGLCAGERCGGTVSQRERHPRHSDLLRWSAVHPRGD